VVQCNIAERGIVDGHGGCMNIGGICIGCTMPGFPDKFSPFYAVSPGSMVSSTTAKIAGGAIRRMRNVTRVDKNLTPRWDGEIPSGWARSRTTPKGSMKLMHKAYHALQSRNQGNAPEYTRKHARPFDGR
jgi:hydrogenase small subunit